MVGNQTKHTCLLLSVLFLKGRRPSLDSTGSYADHRRRMKGGRQGPKSKMPEDTPPVTCMWFSNSRGRALFQERRGSGNCYILKHDLLSHMCNVFTRFVMGWMGGPDSKDLAHFLSGHAPE